MPDDRRTEKTYDGLVSVDSVERGSDGKIYRRTRHFYDGLGRQIKTEYLAKESVEGLDIGDGWATAIKEYDALGRMIRRTDEGGNVAEMHFDVVGRVDYQIDPLGNRIDFVFDQASGLVVEQTSTEVADTNFGGTGPVVRTWTHSYDDMGRRVSSTDPLNSTTTYEYDFEGRVTRTVDPSGDVVETDYDYLGNPVAERRYDAGNGGVVISEEVQTYDLASRVLTRTNAAGLVTTYEYDDLGRQIGVLHPDATEESWQWSSRGLVTRYENQLGSVFVYGYDENGRRMSTTTHAGLGVAGASQTTLYVYDSGGREIGIHAADSSIDRTYNTLGNVTSETQTIGDALPRTFVSTYDIRGKRDSLTFPAIGTEQVSLTFARDA